MSPDEIQQVMAVINSNATVKKTFFSKKLFGDFIGIELEKIQPNGNHRTEALLEFVLQQFLAPGFFNPLLTFKGKKVPERHIPRRMKGLLAAFMDALVAEIKSLEDLDLVENWLLLKLVELKLGPVQNYSSPYRAAFVELIQVELNSRRFSDFINLPQTVEESDLEELEAPE